MMETAPLQIEERHDLTPNQIEAVEEQIYRHNAARTGYRDAAPLAFAAEVEAQLVGVVAGFTWGGNCELRQLWVREDLRGQGLGKRLMNEAVDEARARGCAQILLATYDFQAPGFYTKLGFEVVAELPDKPLGYTEFVMRLRLRSDITHEGS
jgi:GNAT superfamily N-acetyltransferase